MKGSATLLIFTQLTGCATVLMKDREPIAIDSRPPGANAVVQCAGGIRDSTVTPGRVAVPRSADGCVVSLSKDGFATKVIRLERMYNGAYWSNFAVAPGIIAGPFSGINEGSQGVSTALTLTGVFGAAGFIVDRLNGRGLRHDPGEINESLEPIK